MSDVWFFEYAPVEGVWFLHTPGLAPDEVTGRVIKIDGQTFFQTRGKTPLTGEMIEVIRQILTQVDLWWEHEHKGLTRMEIQVLQLRKAEKNLLSLRKILLNKARN